MQHRQQIKAPFQQSVMQSAGASSYVQPQAANETHREYLEIMQGKDAMRLHCAFGHCSDKKLLLSLTKAQHPTSPFAQIYQRTHVSGMHAIIRTPAVPYYKFYSQQQQTIGSRSDMPSNRSKFEF